MVIPDSRTLFCGRVSSNDWQAGGLRTAVTVSWIRDRLKSRRCPMFFNVSATVDSSRWFVISAALVLSIYWLKGYGWVRPGFRQPPDAVFNRAAARCAFTVWGVCDFIMQFNFVFSFSFYRLWNSSGVVDVDWSEKPARGSYTSEVDWMHDRGFFGELFVVSVRRLVCNFLE